MNQLRPGYQNLPAKEFFDVAHWLELNGSLELVRVSLEEMKTGLESNAVDLDTILQLESELCIYGEFREPISLDIDGSIMNGRHRVCALMRTEAPFYHVLIGSLSERVIEEYALIFLDLSDLDGTSFPELFDRALHILSSVRVGDTWYDWTTAGSNYLVFGGVRNFSVDLIPELLKKLNKFGISGTISKVEIDDSEIDY
jgi:hypothetical protein